MIEFESNTVGTRVVSEGNQLRLETENLNLQQLLSRAGVRLAQYESAEKLHGVFLEEINHRLKNVIATASAIVDQSLKGASTIIEAREAVRGRFDILARTYDLLNHASTNGAKLSDVVATIITPFSRSRAHQFLLGDLNVEVSAAAVQPLALVFNELCTNAIKYGALSSEYGVVHVQQMMKGNVRDLIWSETRGPAVSPPERTGFGTRLIDIMAKQLHGRANFKFEPSGVVCQLTIPVDVLQPQSLQAPRQQM